MSGPWPADSVFNRAIDGEFDVVLALYHDQGHIAIKVHDFHGSTTATLGIPFVRTSVDHGTAFDIAGQGKADPRSLAAAVQAAEALVDGRLAAARSAVEVTCDAPDAIDPRMAHSIATNDRAKHEGSRIPRGQSSRWRSRISTSPSPGRARC